MAEGFRSKGHEVSIATQTVPNRPDRESVDGVTIYRFLLRHIAGASIPSRPYRRLVCDPRWDCVIVYGQGVWVSNHLFRILHRIPAKVVYFPVGYYNLERADSRPVRKRILDKAYYAIIQKDLITNADLVIDLTEHNANLTRSIANPNRLAVIPNGVDYGRLQTISPIDVRRLFGIPPDPRLIVHLGGDYPNKRLDIAVDACAPLSDDVRLVLVGVGTESWTQENVTGVGVVSEDLRDAFLQQADLVLLTSDFEGFGLTLLESLACGVPFVSTPVGVAPELATQGGGVVSRTIDAMSVRKALKHALKCPFNAETLRSVAQQYDWPTVVKTIERMIKQLVKGV